VAATTTLRAAFWSRGGALDPHFFVFPPGFLAIDRDSHGSRAMKRKRHATTQRGYGHRHQMMRRKYASLVASGRASCSRCGEPIEPGTPWDLDHSDYDRTRYLGPSHSSCNRAAPNELRTSRDW
jgi:hypothetical protein